MFIYMKTIKLSEKSQTSLGANASHGFFLGGASTSAIFTRPTSLATGGELITGSDNPAPDIFHTSSPSTRRRLGDTFETL